MARLAAWMAEAERHLAATPEDDIARGNAVIPQPLDG
jgi:cytochrome b pre-mRNA-processing protein 3